jgi:uncharacterized phage infection (PIP) family protein YhgE
MNNLFEGIINSFKEEFKQVKTFFTSTIDLTKELKVTKTEVDSIKAEVSEFSELLDSKKSSIQEKIKNVKNETNALKK